MGTLLTNTIYTNKNYIYTNKNWRHISGYIMQTPSHKRIDIFYSMVGVALFVASGAVIIDRYVLILEINNQYFRILVFWGRI